GSRLATTTKSADCSVPDGMFLLVRSARTSLLPVGLGWRRFGRGGRSRAARAGHAVTERDARGEREADAERDRDGDQPVGEPFDGELVEAAVGGEPRQQRGDARERDDERRDAAAAPQQAGG